MDVYRDASNQVDSSAESGEPLPGLNLKYSNFLLSVSEQYTVKKSLTHAYIYICACTYVCLCTTWKVTLFFSLSLSLSIYLYIYISIYLYIYISIYLLFITLSFYAWKPYCRCGCQRGKGRTENW